MNTRAFAAAFALFGVGMAMLGYSFGCIKTRAEFMEAIAKSMADHYQNGGSQ